MIVLAAPSPASVAVDVCVTTGADAVLATLAGLDAVDGAFEMTEGALETACASAGITSCFELDCAVRELTTLLPS
jgi:hypothetical protein